MKKPVKFLIGILGSPSVQDEALLGVEGLCILGHSIFFGMNLTKLDAIHHDKISAFNERERERFLKHH